MRIPHDHKRSSSTMPCWVILFWEMFVCQYLWKSSGPSKLNFFSSEKITFRYSLALIVWYRQAYSSCFSLCFIVNLGWWILFLCLIFSLLKCFLIFLLSQGASIRDFIIFDVDEVCFFLLREQFFSWIVVIIFLACQPGFLFHTYLDFSNNCR